MSNFIVEEVRKSDSKSNKALDMLFTDSGIHRDKNLDYVCAIFDDNQKAIAAGGCFKNTLRCFAVDCAHRGEGLLNTVLTHLINTQFASGNTHLFLYTKTASAKFFRDTGFYEIACGDSMVVFMENRRTGFSDYLLNLQNETRIKLNIKNIPESASVIMNANPFTLGHQYLIEKAAAENDFVHLFVVSEEESLIPFEERKRLVVEGTSHLKNVVIHNCGPYIISNATFPSYFQKDDEEVIDSHAELDLSVFVKIASSLNITSRYVGEEPFSIVTSRYNSIMRKKLPEAGIRCIIVPRKKINGKAVSASNVRLAIKNQDFSTLALLTPKTTVDFFKSNEAQPIIKKLQYLDSSEIVHY